MSCFMREQTFEVVLYRTSTVYFFYKNIRTCTVQVVNVHGPIYNTTIDSFPTIVLQFQLFAIWLICTLFINLFLGSTKLKKRTFYKHLFCRFAALLFKPSAILLDNYFVVQHGCVCPETPRQATQLDFLSRLLHGMRTNKVKKCAERKIIFTG